MKIIALEGLDKSGKHSISNYLFDSLCNQGFKVALGEFHNYKSPTGKLIKEWLYGEFDADQATIELVMLSNKMAEQRTIKDFELEGFDFLILDRYTGSQEAYVEAYTNLSEKNGTIDTVPKDIVKSVQKHFRMPDFTIYLAVSPEISMNRKGKHGDNDRYESDLELLTEVQNFYENRFAKDPSWYRIPAEESLETVETFASDVICEIQRSMQKSNDEGVA
ncbi:dTMP kinase [Enterococcus casseliflavus]|uniref:dTMP kinase n=1 Tax=Enterococcus casseliflavus TaxID=37734 RepID=UPI0039A703E6